MTISEFFGFVQCVMLILIYIETKRPRVVINTIGHVVPGYQPVKSGNGNATPPGDE